MIKSITEILSTCKLFADLSSEEIEQLLDEIEYKIIDYNRHEVFAISGMAVQNMDIVLAGSMTTKMISPSGKEVIIGHLYPGFIVASAFLFSDDNHYPVNVETDSETTILRISKESLVDLINFDDKIRFNFINVISNGASFLSKKVRFIGLSSVYEKVSAFLMKEAMQQKSRTIHLRHSRKEIAESFGIQKYSLLRVLSEMEMKGIIKVDEKSITILDSDILQV